MSPVIARKAMEMLKQTVRQPSEEKNKPSSESLLSDREMDILKELATGKSYKAIGEKAIYQPFYRAEACKQYLQQTSC